jgi:cytochrome b561
MATNLQRYNLVAIILHWVTALLIIYMLVWGGGLIKGQPWNHVAATNPGLHASLGLSILILTAARLVWRLMNPPPPDVPMPKWQALASHVLHWGLYALLVLIPLSGLAALDKSIADKHPEYADLTFFNLFTMPHFSLPWFGSTHGLLTNLTWALLALHVVAALKHQFIDKDRLMNRMSLR